MSVDIQGPDQQGQPLLPRVSMVWYFVVVVLVAIALFVIRAAEQGQALAAALTFTCVFLLAVALISAACFIVAYLLGAMEKALEGDREKTASPFIDGSYPEQLIPPKPSEDI